MTKRTMRRGYWPAGANGRLSVWLVGLLLVLLLAACGDATPTAPVSTSTTTLAATSQAATTTVTTTTGATTQAATTTTAPTGTVTTAAAAPSGQTVNLTYDMIDTATEVAGWTAQVDAANKQLAPKGIHINIRKIPGQWTDYYTKVSAELAAGKGADIGRVAESLLPELIDKGQIVDLSDTVKQLDMSQFYDKPFQNAGYRSGKSYGIPSGIYYMLLYYNQDMLDKAGIKLSKDWNNATTLDQVAQYAKQLTSGSGGSKIYGFYSGPYMSFVGMFSVANGGKNIFNSDGTCAMTDPQSVGVYRWFDQMLHTDKSMPTPADSSVQSPFDMFKAGRLAMIADGTWDQQSIKNDIKKFKVGVAAIPAGTGKSVTAAFTDSFVLFKNAPHEREAREALLALQSQEAITALSATGVGGLPIRKDVLSANVDQLIGSQFTAEDKAVFTSGLDHTQPVPYNQYYQQADEALNAVMDQWQNGKINTDQWAGQVCSTLNKFRSSSGQ